MSHIILGSIIYKFLALCSPNAPCEWSLRPISSKRRISLEGDGRYDFPRPPGKHQSTQKLRSKIVNQMLPKKMTNNLQWIISKREIGQNPAKSRFFCLKKPSFGTLGHTHFLAPSTCSPWAKLSRFSPTRIDALANWPHGCHGGWWKSKFVGHIHLFDSYQVAFTWRVFLFLLRNLDEPGCGAASGLPLLK